MRMSPSRFIRAMTVTYEKDEQELEKSVVLLGVVYASSFIALIVWLLN